MTLDSKDFEIGEDVTDHVVRSKTPGLVVSARLDREDAKRLFALAKEMDRTPSQLAREALRRYMADAERAAIIHGQTVFTNQGVWISEGRQIVATDTVMIGVQIMNPTPPFKGYIVKGMAQTGMVPQEGGAFASLS
jgi:predicted transcriptional regulator